MNDIIKTTEEILQEQLSSRDYKHGFNRGVVQGIFIGFMMAIGSLVVASIIFIVTLKNTLP